MLAYFAAAAFICLDPGHGTISRVGAQTETILSVCQSMLVGHVRVRASPGAVQLVQDRGGKLYVWAKKTRCGGSVFFLETSSEASARPFRRVPARLRGPSPVGQRFDVSR